MLQVNYDSRSNLYRLAQAHYIRNRTKAFGAILNLRTERKWCISGTPVQNSLDDMFSLTEFLGFYPVENRLSARRWILDPLGARDEDAIENLRLLITSITLRRSQDSERNGMRSEHEVTVILSPAERELYNSIRSKARTCLSPHDRFSCILRMRKLCSHGLRGRSQPQRDENAATAQKIDHGLSVCHKCGEDLSPILSLSSTSKLSKALQLCFECADEQDESANSITELSSPQDSTGEEQKSLVSKLNVGMLDSASDNDVDMDRDQIDYEYPEQSAKIRSVLSNLLKFQEERHRDTTPIKRYEMLIRLTNHAHSFSV